MPACGASIDAGLDQWYCLELRLASCLWDSEQMCLALEQMCKFVFGKSSEVTKSFLEILHRH